MQFAHSGSETEKQPPPHPVPSHTVSPRRPAAPRPRLSTTLRPCHSMVPSTYQPTTPYPCRFIATSPAPSHNATASPPCPGTVQEPHHSGKPIHPQHRAMAATRAASRRCTIAPKPRHLTTSRQVRLAPPRHCSRAAGNLKTKKWPVLQLFCDYGLPQEPPVAN